MRYFLRPHGDKAQWNHAKNMSEDFTSVRNTCLHKLQKENRSLILRKLCICKSKIQIRLTVSPAPSSGCEMIVPVAHQVARGSGHKGSQSLRTSRKGLWQRALVSGDREQLPAQSEHSVIMY